MKRFWMIAVTAFLCCLLAVPCFAANTPAIQVYHTYAHKNSVGGVEPTIGWRNTSGKTIKYVDWYLTAYNSVGDPVRCDISGKSTIIAESIGPIESYTPISDSGQLNYYFGSWNIYGWNDNSDNYSYSIVCDYDFLTSEEKRDFNFLLTDDEVQNAVYDHKSEFEPCWYNYAIDDFKISKAIVTFMDGSKVTVAGNQIYSPYYRHIHTNKSYGTLMEHYASVYNRQDYMQYNPDVHDAIGSNQYLLLNHFINFGMKEGRQASSEFNLDAYKANNPDLVAIFGDDNVKYYEHYISSGKAEGRKAT